MLKQLGLIFLFLCLVSNITFAEDPFTDIGFLDSPSTQFIGLYRLTFQPDSITTLNPGRFKFKFTATDANYWFGSKDYFIDGEIAQFSLKASYGIVEKLELSAQFRFIWQGGGVFDNLIESFHHLFGFPNARRERFPQNRLRFINWGANHIDWEPGVSLNDLQLIAKVSLIDQYLSVKTDLRFPINSLSTAFGAQVSLQSQVLTEVVNFLVSIGFSLHEQETFFFYRTSRLQYFGMVQVRFKTSTNFGVVLGTAASSKPIQAKGIENLSENAYEFHLGIQWVITDRWLLQLAIIEDGIKHGNSPDVGFHLSLTIQ